MVTQFYNGSFMRRSFSLFSQLATYLLLCHLCATLPSSKNDTQPFYLQSTVSAIDNYHREDKCLYAVDRTVVRLQRLQSNPRTVCGPVILQRFYAGIQRPFFCAQHYHWLIERLCNFLQQSFRQKKPDFDQLIS